MKKKRLLFVVLGALVALAVAVPAAVALSGLAGESGYIRMYQYDKVDNTYQIANPKSTVRFSYDAKVEGYSVNWMLAATMLPPVEDGEWALVQIDDAHEWDGDDYWWEVTVIATGCANRKGMLSMKAQGTSFASPDLGEWHRFTGADVWLVPAHDIDYWDGNYAELNTDSDFCVEDDWYLASLGVPVDFADYVDPYDEY